MSHMILSCRSTFSIVSIVSFTALSSAKQMKIISLPEATSATDEVTSTRKSFFCASSSDLAILLL